jgi:thiol-disulfide isomerase/thioredoxin
MNRRWPYVAACAAGLLVGVGLLIRMGTHAALGGGDGPESLKGKEAPDFSLRTVDDKDAKLSSLKGNVVVVDFWATWCPPCRQSLPHIQKMSGDKELADKGLKVFAVNDREGKDNIEPFLKENKYTFTVPMDVEGKALEAYKSDGIPATIVVGRDGTVKAVFVGYEGDQTARQIDEAVEAALKEKAPAA